LNAFVDVALVVVVSVIFDAACFNIIASRAISGGYMFKCAGVGVAASRGYEEPL